MAAGTRLDLSERMMFAIHTSKKQDRSLGQRLTAAVRGEAA
jgi:hypothetical protein